MNMRLLKNISFLVLPLLVLTISLTSCENDDDPVAVNNIDTLLSKNGNLGIFRAALEKTGLITYAKGGGPFTIFAPSDAAFKASGINSPADLDAIDGNLLAQVLAYHIMNGKRTFVEIPSGPNAPGTTVGTLPIYASKNANGGYINGAKISQSDIIATNGVIHVIDRVLAPPVGNSLVTLQANPNFKLLVQGLNKASLTAPLTAATPVYTVMAPTNAAFIAAGYDSTAIANLSGAALTSFTNMLRYHLVTGRLFSSEFKDGTLKTLQGTGLSITVSGGPKVKGPANPAAINITPTDWPTSNGVIQTISGLLRYQ